MMPPPPSELFELGAFRLDAAGRVLLRDGKVVPMSPKAIDTLVVLVREPGVIVDRERLMRTVWPDTFVEEAGLTRNISVLRKALESDGLPQAIETVPKRGYRLLLPVTRVEPESRRVVVQAEALPAPIAALPAVDPPPSVWFGPLPIGVLAAMALGVAALLLQVRPGPQETSNTTLAVLPFASAQPGDDGRVLGAAMADALGARIAADRTVEVRSSRSTQGFTADDRDPIAIGRELNVDRIVTGDVSRDANGLRVTARLIDVSTGGTTWTDGFTAPSSDLFGLHDRVAHAIAQEIGRPLPRRAAGAHRPKSAEAYDAYLAGRHHWNRRTRESLELATTHFSTALDLDPAYPAAYAGLADAYALRGVYGGIAPADAFARARAAAMRAIDLDPELASAYASLGFAQFAFDWDWDAAGRSYARAIELDPNYATAHHWNGILMMVRGRGDDAVRSMQRAERLDPLSPSIPNDMMEILRFSKRYTEALAYGKERMRLHPTDVRLQASMAGVLHYLHRDKEAIEILRRSPHVTDYTQALEVRALLRTGDRPAAEAMYEKLLARAAAEKRGADRFQVAVILLVLGRVDEAFGELELAYQERLVSLTWLKVQPELNAYRTDPRFVDLLQRLRLAD